MLNYQRVNSINSTKSQKMSKSKLATNHHGRYSSTGDCLISTAYSDRSQCVSRCSNLSFVSSQKGSMVSLETPSRTDSVQGWLDGLQKGGHRWSLNFRNVFVCVHHFSWFFVLVMFAMFVMMRVAPLVWGLPFGTGQASIAVPFSPSPDSGPSGTMSTSRASIHSLSFLKPAGLCETLAQAPVKVQDGSGAMISREFPMDLHEYVRVRSAMPNALDSWNLERTWKNHVAGKHLNFRKVWPCLKENEQESLNVLMSHVRHVFMHCLSTVDDAHHTQAQIMGIVGLQKQPLVPPRRCRAAQLSWDKPTKFVPTKLLQARPRIPTSVVERRASWRQPATLVLLAQLVMHHHWILCFQSRLLQLARDCAAAIAHRSVCYTEYGALFQLALCLALIWLIPVPTKSGLKTCNMCNLCLQIGHMS